jgi:AcrR family transcriptional regulator
MATTRMTKEERRRQLLETAFEIIRTEGTDALSLVRLADRAGVSHPVPYEHFKTREGLLLALFRDYDERLGESMRAAVAAQAESLEDVARILSAAYVDGVVAAGSECAEVSAALAGNETTRSFRQESRDFYVRELREAFAPFVALDSRPGAALLVGIHSATEGLAHAAAAGRMSRSAAVSAATTIMLGALRVHAALTAP